MRAYCPSPAGAVGLPGPKADPAELCLARAAVHVVTAPILLNGGMALGTLLWVSQQIG